jgi:hypothetical protein
MSVPPRVLLSIDYEPWFALFRRFEKLTDSFHRRNLDDGFTLRALDPILNMLGDAKASFYLVGEVAEWYPEIPQRIVSAGHELGFHCHVHRPLKNEEEVARDLSASSSWLKQFNVRGFRAPMIGISESAYKLLHEHGLTYSSSIYAPAGVLLQKDNIWEIPVSTIGGYHENNTYTAPRDFTFKLLFHGEFPYGSSFSIGLMPGQILKIIERDLNRGRSPAIFLHPYELVKPFPYSHITRDVLLNPHLLPFLRDKSNFLKTLLRHFPVSSFGVYLDEILKTKAV